jgi:hypothetical protein
MIADCGVLSPTTARASLGVAAKAPARAQSAPPAWAKSSLSGCASAAAVDVARRGRFAPVRPVAVRTARPAGFGGARFVPVGAVASKGATHLVS